MIAEREKLIGCLQSFYRNRHGQRQRYKKSKRHHGETVNVHRRYCEIVRSYIQRIRALEV